MLTIKRVVMQILVVTAIIGIQPFVFAEVGESRHESVVRELDALLGSEPSLRKNLEAAITNAQVKDIRNLDEFYAYLDGILHWIPTEREFVPRILNLYYIANQAPDDALNKDELFNTWLKHFVQAYGAFMDTPASAGGIASFAEKPNYNISDYYVGPSGWLTFNQFFAREVRPGKRPIADPRDDRVIVSPADAVFMGSWPINEDSQITVKGVNWAISELLEGSPYAQSFKNGLYTHSFLYVDDYHRYHVPVAGTIKEIRNISGRVYMDVVKTAEGVLDVVDGDTYQFNQERGLVVIDSPVLGLVAVLPIGMSYVSSVNLTPEEGAGLRKGDQFGYFLFGGSDIVMVFQDKDIVIEAQVGTKYLQGERLGFAR